MRGQLRYHPAMTEQNDILEISIATPLRRSFDYLLPNNVEQQHIKIGQRVQVPFGRRTQIGIVMQSKNHSDFGRDKLKAADCLLDDESWFTPQIIELCQWASVYYQHSLGDILLSCLPASMRKGKTITPPEQKPTEKKEQDRRPTLNGEQQHAVNNINQSNGFNIFLLEGITGSGKTEVYLNCIENIIKQGKQALVLVPEIGLTPQTVERFEKRFDVPISMLHSGMTDKKRSEQWVLARKGVSKIIIGTRSAILTPIPNLGIVIIDEEHDLSFKQQSGFRYCARSMAIMRAKIENIPIVLGTATPVLESLHNALTGRYQHLTLSMRAGVATQPHYHIIDIRHKKLEHGLSPKLLEKIRTHLDNNNQVLMFLNRRGFSPSLVCHDCGWTAECPHCDAKMTYHAHSNDLHCHHCATRRPRYPQCLSCKSRELVNIGMGTEKLEQILSELFSDVPVIRIDRDTTTKKNAMKKLLAQVQHGEKQILVGTQMLAKGHHFKNVTMVGILDADAGMLSADFRALERLGQTLLQVAGRAGREEKQGEVFIQTYCPNNPLLHVLLNEGYHPFAKAILQQRQLTQLPPYSFMVLIRAEGSSLIKPNTFLEDAKKIAAKYLNGNNIKMYGPVPASMVRKAGQFRTQLLLQSPSRKQLQQLLATIMTELDALPSGKKVRWSIDIDPQEIL